MTDRVLILDFGSQVTQLIARRVRESGVYCEIRPYNEPADAIRDFAPRAVILSGGPASVTEAAAPRAPDVLFELGVPVLGVCYGQQAMTAQLGASDCLLFEGLWETGRHEQVWMSHGDRVTKLAPGFRAVAVSDGAPFAAIADDSRRFYGVQFHPEVVHTPHGAALLRNFTHHVAGCTGDWTMAAFRQQAVARIREQVGKGRVLCGLSGGVDSSVAAVLLHEAIGEQLLCVFVDTGVLRAGEADEVVSIFRDHYNIPLVHRDARALFLARQGRASPSSPTTMSAACRRACA